MLKFIFFALIASTVLPATGARADGNALNAADFKGKSFCTFMMEAVIPAMKAQENAPFTVPDSATVKALLPTTFAPDVVRKDLGIFNDEASGVYTLIDALQGAQFTPDTFPGALAKKLDDLKLVQAGKVGLDGAILAPLLGILAKAGITIKWTDTNITTEFGYKFRNLSDKTSLAQDVKSGRGFGQSGERGALDASDAFLLGEAEKVFEAKKDNTEVFKVLFEILHNMDTSGFSKLNSDEQTFLTDLLTVMVAEFARADMTGLNKAGTDFISHPWQKDLLTTILLGTFVAEVKALIKNGKVFGGSLPDFFGIGQSGSGIGETRKDREHLQTVISKFEASTESEVKIQGIIGTGAADIYQGYADYVFNPMKATELAAKGPELTNALLQFLAQVRADGPKILASMVTDLGGDPAVPAPKTNKKNDPPPARKPVPKAS